MRMPTGENVPTEGPVTTRSETALETEQEQASSVESGWDRVVTRSCTGSGPLEIWIWVEMRGYWRDPDV
jgi:hypothetical protein